MARVDLIRHTDGTITARHGRRKASFMEEPWMTRDDIIERAKWEFVMLGVPLKRDVSFRLVSRQ